METPSLCPFCGGMPYLTKTERAGYQDFPDDPDRFAYTMVCRSCAAEGPWQKSESSARRMWEMRVKDTGRYLVTGQVVREISESIELVLWGLLDEPPEEEAIVIRRPATLPEWTLKHSVFEAYLPTSIESVAQLSANPDALTGFHRRAGARPWLRAEDMHLAQVDVVPSEAGWWWLWDKDHLRIVPVHVVDGEDGLDVRVADDVFGIAVWARVDDFTGRWGGRCLGMLVSPPIDSSAATR